MKMCKYVFIVVVLATFTSCLNRTGRKDLATTEKIECTDSIRMLNLITEALKIDRSALFNIEEDRQLRPIKISRLNLPYEFADFERDNLPAIKFIPADTLAIRGYENIIFFDPIEITSDTTYVYFSSSPGHSWVIRSKFYTKECEPILLDYGIVHVNRIDFVNPDRLE